MFQQSGSYGNVDPNVQRVLQETVSIITDVDRRLQALKVGLTQAVPQLAPALLTATNPQATLGMGMQTPFGMQSPGIMNPWVQSMPGFVGPLGTPFPFAPGLAPTMGMAGIPPTMGVPGLIPNVGGIGQATTPWTGIPQTQTANQASPFQPLQGVGSGAGWSPFRL